MNSINEPVPVFDNGTYNHLMIEAYKWTQSELYKAFRLLAFNTSYEQLEELFGKKINPSKKEIAKTGKVIQKARDRITTKLQIELCLKHLICPECAGDLSKTLCQTKNKYWDVYQCKNCKFRIKRISRQ